MLPMDEIKAMVENEKEEHTLQEFKTDLPMQNAFNPKSFDEFLEKNPDLEEEYNRVNRKQFKQYADQAVDVTKSATNVTKFKAKYEAEEWFYKRHKDTIDRYCNKRKTDENEAEPIRIGYVKMVSIVMFDLIVVTLLFNCILCAPVHLVKCISELFFKMRKPVMITTLIILGVVLLATLMIMGVEWLTSLKIG